MNTELIYNRRKFVEVYGLTEDDIIIRNGRAGVYREDEDGNVWVELPEVFQGMEV